MSRAYTSEVLDALEARVVVAIDLLWIIARDRDTGDEVAAGMHTDVGNLSVPVINPDTGGQVTRDFFGTGTLVRIPDVPAVARVQVQDITIVMSQMNELVEQFVREYDCKQARVEIYRGLLDPNSRGLVSPAYPRYVGRCDKIEIKTPSENEEGGVFLTCVSHTQEMTRSNPDTRSHVSQKKRDSGDAFYKDTSLAGDFRQDWGDTDGKVPSRPKGLFGLGFFGL